MPLRDYEEVERIAHRMLAEIDYGKDESLWKTAQQLCHLARAMRSDLHALEARLSRLEAGATPTQHRSAVPLEPPLAD
jgi:hypothetical protein